MVDRVHGVEQQQHRILLADNIVTMMVMTIDGHQCAIIETLAEKCHHHHESFAIRLDLAAIDLQETIDQRMVVVIGVLATRLTIVGNRITVDNNIVTITK